MPDAMSNVATSIHVVWKKQGPQDKPYNTGPNPFSCGPSMMDDIHNQSTLL